MKGSISDDLIADVRLTEQLLPGQFAVIPLNIPLLRASQRWSGGGGLLREYAWTHYFTEPQLQYGEGQTIKHNRNRERCTQLLTEGHVSRPLRPLNILPLTSVCEADGGGGGCTALQHLMVRLKVVPTPSKENCSTEN